MQTFDSEVRNFLSGRIWLRSHTPFAVDLIDTHIKSGHIQTMPGITEVKTAFRTNVHCNRCQNDEPFRFTIFDCAKCKGPCTYCRKCLNMGRVSTCTELIEWAGEPIVYPQKHALAWKGTLTSQQQRASEDLLGSTTKGKSHLLYAVCGAGKTEVLFEPIYHALTEGKRVCLAAPRVDVILELEPRLREAFPSTAIEALYGGAKPGIESAQLILATTHQLYRFKEAFDVIFVDEADAFPYTADDTLVRAVEKAARSKAPIHLVTATPTQKIIQARKRTGAVTLIQRRYHGYALPTPRYESLWRYEKQFQKSVLPKKLERWTEEKLKNKEPFLIFFPTIALMEKAEPLFQQLNEKIKAVHAAHPERKESVQALRNKKTPGLLTTTILERGITIPNIQVAIVGAEQAIFDKGAIIQIGGRVGRSVDYPKGDFVLFHHGMTYAMDDAKREIHKLNKGSVKL